MYGFVRIGGGAMVVLFFAPTLLGAQGTAFLESGVLVRVESPRYAGVATVHVVDDDTLRVMIESRGSPLSIAAASVTSLEIRRPSSIGERAVRGATYGALIGGGLGLMATFLADGGTDNPPRVTWPFLYAAVYGGVGVLVALPLPQHRWERIPLPDQIGVSWQDGTTWLSATIKI